MNKNRSPMSRCLQCVPVYGQRGVLSSELLASLAFEARLAPCPAGMTASNSVDGRCGQGQKLMCCSPTRSSSSVCESRRGHKYRGALVLFEIVHKLRHSGTLIHPDARLNARGTPGETTTSPDTGADCRVRQLADWPMNMVRRP